MATKKKIITKPEKEAPRAENAQAVLNALAGSGDYAPTAAEVKAVVADLGGSPDYIAAVQAQARAFLDAL